MEDYIKPATFSYDGVDYELDFNKDAVRFAENRGFEIDSVTRFPSTKIPELFYYSLRMHHKRMSRDQADKLFAEIGGLPTKVVGRLIDLYQQAALSGVIAMDEDEEKNVKVTFDL